MPAIVDFPEVIKQALPYFAGCFPCDPQRTHFMEYLTGLMVATKKTVNGMNAEFAQTTDQSCLNRFLTEVEWDAEQLNQPRALTRLTTIGQACRAMTVETLRTTLEWAIIEITEKNRSPDHVKTQLGLT